MSLQCWCKNGWLRKQDPNCRQIVQSLEASFRDVEASQHNQLPLEWQFRIAYNAILQAATAALAACGYRASRDSPHYRVLKSLSFTVGLSSATVDVLDKYRKKRHESVYEKVGAVSKSEAESIIKLAKEIHGVVVEWMSREHHEIAAAFSKKR